MFTRLNPFGTCDANGVPVKTSPPRTEEEQAAIDEFVRRRGVTRVHRNASTFEPQFNNHRANSAAEFALNRQRGRVRAMLMYLRDRGAPNQSMWRWLAGIPAGQALIL